MATMMPKHSPTPTSSPHETKEKSDAGPSHDRVDKARMEETDRTSSPTPFKITPKAPGEL